MQSKREGLLHYGDEGKREAPLERAGPAGLMIANRSLTGGGYHNPQRALSRKLPLEKHVRASIVSEGRLLLT